MGVRGFRGAVGDAMAKTFLAKLGCEPTHPHGLLNSPAKHASLLQSAGRAVVTMLHTYEVSHVTEAKCPINALRRYL